MIPFTIYIDRELLPELEGEFYLADLKGLKCLDSISNEEIGIVSDYFDNGAQDILSLKINSEIIELPFVEQFFPELDIEQGWIKVSLPTFIE